MAGHPAPVTVTTSRAAARVAWSAGPRLTWMYTDDPGLRGLLQALRDRGVREAAVLTGSNVPRDVLSVFGSVEEAHEPALAAVGMTLFMLRAPAS